MIIGIDIDDTLTDIKDELQEQALILAKSLGKVINENININDSQISESIYKVKYGFNYDELKYFLKVIHEKISQNALPRLNAKECINELKSKGHKIYIITARDVEFHDNPYELSKLWLDKNNIKYDKIIVNARKKSLVCKQENVDLFIDDDLKNCLELSNENIKTIRISEDKNVYENFITLRNWDEIYNYIIEME